MRKTLYILAMLGSLAGLQSCGDQADFTNKIKPATGAKVKFYHYADAPGVNIFVNDKKISGILTVPPALPGTLTYGSAYPVTDYSLLTAGAATVRVVVPATATTGEVTAIQASVPNLADNAFYSVFAVGTSTTPGYSAVVMEDKFTNPNTEQANVRFVNLLQRGVATGYDLYLAGNRIYSGVLGTNNNEAFQPITSVPIGSASQTLQVRVGGSAATSAVIASTTITPLPNRYYTIALRGVVGNTARPAALSVVQNL
jgi:Domain of unknown function (DUF4397)